MRASVVAFCVMMQVVSKIATSSRVFVNINIIKCKKLALKIYLRGVHLQSSGVEIPKMELNQILGCE